MPPDPMISTREALLREYMSRNEDLERAYSVLVASCEAITQDRDLWYRRWQSCRSQLTGAVVTAAVEALAILLSLLMMWGWL